MKPQHRCRRALDRAGPGAAQSPIAGYRRG
jgi:hypothetical protein